MQMCLYLTFDGTAMDALTFYADVLNGELAAVMRYDEMPGAEGKYSAEVGARLAHGQVRFGDQVIMVSDRMGDDPFEGYHGFTVQTNWDTVEEAEAAFTKISEGGTISMPFGPTFWAKGFGVCRDKFGVGWMVNGA